MKKLVCLFVFLIFSSCAIVQPTRSNMYLPDCTPGEVIFIENTHENAWVEIAEGVHVRRIEVRITDEDCEMQNFSPPMFAYFTAGMKQLKALHLWKGEWIPSSEVPGKGFYRYTHIVTFEGNTVQRIYDIASEFIKDILVKK